MAADRGAYIDQSQSLNIHMVDANPAKVTSMHFYGWKQGLKACTQGRSRRHPVTEASTKEDQRWVARRASRRRRHPVHLDSP